VGEDAADEYEVVDLDVSKMEGYEPPPDLVIDFANLAAPKTTRELEVSAAATKAAAELIGDMLGISVSQTEGGSSVLVVKPLAMLPFLKKWGPLTVPDDERPPIGFSEAAQSVAEALDAAQAGDLARGFRIARELYRETKLGDLLGVLALQLEALLFAGNMPKRCRECGRFFTGRRRQAVYCKDECRFKFNMRASRRRARARRTARKKEE
jgi:hypothetical protein